jgi:hypothetical protein
MDSMRLKLVACDVLTRELCILIAQSPHVFDIEFTEKDSHTHSEVLRRLIQEKIDRSAGKGYNAVLLAYGLCGNSTAGLEARDTRVVIPRAHDCCTLFLGSKERFKQNFKDNPSQPFSSPGYMERSDVLFHDGLGEKNMTQDPVYREYVKKYGEDNATYIWETMHGTKIKHEKLVYIEIPETRNSRYAELCRKRAEESGLKFVPLEGSLEILKNLVFGNWKSEDFLILRPGSRSKGLYDWEEIIGSEVI